MITALFWLPSHFDVAIWAKNQSFAADPFVRVCYCECYSLLGWDVEAGIAYGVVNLDFGDS